MLSAKSYKSSFSRNSEEEGQLMVPLQGISSDVKAYGSQLLIARNANSVVASGEKTQPSSRLHIFAASDEVQHQIAQLKIINEIIEHLEPSLFRAGTAVPACLISSIAMFAGAVLYGVTFGSEGVSTPAGILKVSIASVLELGGLIVLCCVCKQGNLVDPSRIYPLRSDEYKTINDKLARVNSPSVNFENVGRSIYALNSAILEHKNQIEQDYGKAMVYKELKRLGLFSVNGGVNSSADENTITAANRGCQMLTLVAEYAFK